MIALAPFYQKIRFIFLHPLELLALKEKQY